MSETAQTENQDFKFAPPSVTAVLFDADAPQRVELILKRTDSQGKIVKNKVAHLFAPMIDEQFFRHEDKKSIVQKISGTDLLNVRTHDKNLQAAEWLWNELVIEREGYKQRDDWKEKTNLLDKQKAVEQGLLAVFVAQDNDTDVFADTTLDADAITDDEEFSDEEVDDEAQTVIRLDCLFNSQPLTTTHYFKQPSAKDITDYENTMRKSSNMVDGRKGFRQKKGNQQAQISIPSKARELCALYDRLIINTEGYAGRTPAHHKREAVLEIFTRDTDVTEGK